jgi:fatty acid desaturase
MKHQHAAGFDVSGLARGRLRTVFRAIEWRTVLLIFGCYSAWFAAGMVYEIAPLISVALFVVPIALHSSLQHEAIHSHPTRNALLNEALVCLPLGLLIPYRRYRDLHLRHHVDDRITDPYDDPESFYRDGAAYERLPRALKAVLAWNNMLAVRVVIGPAISAITFLLREVQEISLLHGDATRRAWLLHGGGLLVVLAIVQFGFGMPVYAYLGAVYFAFSLLAVRSFGEHQWAEAPAHRTVIIERSRLGWLFLNNNLHLVHHSHPGLPWYALPAARAQQWLCVRGLSRGLARVRLAAKGACRSSP